jgi:hypothetical protein
VKEPGSDYFYSEAPTAGSDATGGMRYQDSDVTSGEIQTLGAIRKPSAPDLGSSRGFQTESSGNTHVDTIRQGQKAVSKLGWDFSALNVI